MSGARWTVVLIFLAALVAHVVSLLAAYRAGDIRAGTLQNLILAILALYSIPLGTIMGGMFARPKVIRGKPILGPAILAVLLAVIWNALLLARTIMYAFGSSVETPADLTNYLTSISTTSTFLISGSITYFFVKETSA